MSIWFSNARTLNMSGSSAYYLTMSWDWKHSQSPTSLSSLKSLHWNMKWCEPKTLQNIISDISNYMLGRFANMARISILYITKFPKMNQNFKGLLMILCVGRRSFKMSYQHHQLCRGLTPFNRNYRNSILEHSPKRVYPWVIRYNTLSKET